MHVIAGWAARLFFVVLSILAIAVPSNASVVIDPQPGVPPPCGGCVWIAQGPLVFGTNALLNLRIDSFSGIIRTPSPPDEVQSYNALGSGRLQIGSFFDVFFDVTVVTLSVNPPPGNLGTFQTEMLSMSLVSTSGPPVMIRESPTQQSLGLTTVTPLGASGPYTFNSFFDVFTELSLDGGQSWIPSQGPTRLLLTTPEPAAAVLVTSGLLAAAALFWKRRRRWQ